MGIRRRRRGRKDDFPSILIALGIGVFVALFCSVKLILFFAAIALIYLGSTYYSC